jgi:chromosome segregation ATPase
LDKKVQELNEAEEKNKKMTDELSIAKSDLQQCKSTLEKTEKEKIALDQKVQQLQTKLKQTSTRIVCLEAEKNKLADQNTELEKKNKKLVADLDKSSCRNICLQDQNTELEKKNTKVIEEATLREAELQDVNSQLRESLLSAETDRHKLRHEVENYKKELKDHNHQQQQQHPQQQQQQQQQPSRSDASNVSSRRPEQANRLQPGANMNVTAGGFEKYFSWLLYLDGM